MLKAWQAFSSIESIQTASEFIGIFFKRKKNAQHVPEPHFSYVPNIRFFFSFFIDQIYSLNRFPECFFLYILPIKKSIFIPYIFNSYTTDI